MTNEAEMAPTVKTTPEYGEKAEEGRDQVKS